MKQRDSKIFTNAFNFDILKPPNNKLAVSKYSKTCLKRKAIFPVFLSVFTGFLFTKGCVLIKQSKKNMIA
jgi:hypothetical protein